MTMMMMMRSAAVQQWQRFKQEVGWLSGTVEPPWSRESYHQSTATQVVSEW